MAGLIGIGLGYNHGLEAGELPLYAEIPIFLVTATATAQFLVTISRRLEPPLYVALWYLIGAFIWTTMNLVLGSFILPYTISGINSAEFHGLYIHYIVGLWLTPAGYVLIYYFLPVTVRNPLYAHKLSLVGFWSLRFVLSVRRHPSLSLQPDRRLGRNDRDHHLHAADHSGVDRAGELLRHGERQVGGLRQRICRRSS